LTEVIIFLGPPGAGKGTQAEKVSNKYNLAHISTGVMLRQHVENETELGLKARNLLDNGLLVPDDLVTEMLLERLNENDAASVVLLDGYPRTLTQAESLERPENNLLIKKVIFFDIDQDELITRMLERGRSDDTEDSIQVRLEAYKEDTEPLLHYYEKKGLVKRVNGSGSVDSIFKSIENVLT